MSDNKWSEGKILRALACGGPFDYTGNFVVIPNVSYGFLNWEADLLACSKAGYLTEVEVKISAYDFKKDRLKMKWHQSRIKIKEFYYCAPVSLARRWEEFSIPDFAGVIAAEFDSKGQIRFETIRQAKRLEHHKLTDKEMAKLARLGALRIWDLKK